MNSNSHTGGTEAAERPYLTPNEAASMLMVAPNTLRLWSEKGLLHAQTTAGGHRRFLREEVERFVRERNARQVISDTATVQRVLIVDDDPAFARYLDSLISGAGNSAAVTTAVAHDGFEAGHMLHIFRPQVILLDLMMPGLDGFQVCHMIKHEAATRAIRIIAMTGYPTPANVQRILSSGAEACLAKPIDDERLLELLGLDGDGFFSSINLP